MPETIHPAISIQFRVQISLTPPLLLNTDCALSRLPSITNMVRLHLAVPAQRQQQPLVVRFEADVLVRVLLLVELLRQTVPEVERHLRHLLEEERTS